MKYERNYEIPQVLNHDVQLCDCGSIPHLI